MKENKRKVKKRYRQKARQFISGLVITAMLAPNMTPIIAQAAELIRNEPDPMWRLNWLLAFATGH